MSNWLFLSPHLDDAVLSCGGLIATLTRVHRVTVATVFAFAPWFGPYSRIAGWLHGISGGRNAAFLARARRREDALACGRLGAVYQHLKWHDAVYRKSRRGNFLYPDVIQTAVSPEDNALVDTLAREIDRRAAGFDYLVVPLGIGRHVDHLIVREAAERSGRHLLYYPDIPYLWEHSGDLSVRTTGLIRIDYEVSHQFVTSWVAAALDYRSQQKMLNDFVAPLDGRLREYSSGQLGLYLGAAHKSPELK